MNGIENILKENKSIIIDPSEIKKLFDKKVLILMQYLTYLKINLI